MNSKKNRNQAEACQEVAAQVNMLYETPCEMSVKVIKAEPEAQSSGKASGGWPNNSDAQDALASLKRDLERIEAEIAARALDESEVVPVVRALVGAMLALRQNLPKRLRTPRVIVAKVMPKAAEPERQKKGRGEGQVEPKRKRSK